MPIQLVQFRPHPGVLFHFPPLCHKLQFNPVARGISAEGTLLHILVQFQMHIQAHIQLRIIVDSHIHPIPVASNKVSSGSSQLYSLLRLIPISTSLPAPSTGAGSPLSSQSFRRGSNSVSLLKICSAATHPRFLPSSARLRSLSSSSMLLQISLIWSPSNRHPALLINPIPKILSSDKMINSYPHPCSMRLNTAKMSNPKMTSTILLFPNNRSLLLKSSNPRSFLFLLLLLLMTSSPSSPSHPRRILRSLLRLSLPRLRYPSLPRLRYPRLRLPRLRHPRLRLPRLSLPRCPTLVIPRRLPRLLSTPNPNPSRSDSEHRCGSYSTGALAEATLSPIRAKHREKKQC